VLIHNSFEKLKTKSSFVDSTRSISISFLSIEPQSRMIAPSSKSQTEKWQPSGSSIIDQELHLFIRKEKGRSTDIDVHLAAHPFRDINAIPRELTIQGEMILLQPWQRITRLVPTSMVTPKAPIPRHQLSTSST
jgi:hypothetical protein